VLGEATAWAAAAFVVPGERDAAMTVLESAPRNAFVRHNPGLEVLDPIRVEPQFRRLLELLRG
jgi:hypothetical protein